MAIAVPERYVFVRDLAPGGMSSVSIYRDTNLDRDVVIKVIAPGEHYRRAYDEIAALECLRSDYVVNVFDVLVDKHSREIGIVQEYLAGEDLGDYIRATHTRSSPDNLRTLFQISTGVADIHSAGVVHRDIKPQNLRILPDGRIVILTSA